MIHNEEQLDDVLSTPRPGDRVDGDLLILGAAGKMGPTLAMRAKRAGTPRVFAAARFSSPVVRERLERAGVETIVADLLEPGVLEKLPATPNVVFMAAMKFGTTGAEHMTWAMNTFLPGLVAERFQHSRIVAFSTGNVYPLVPITSGGASEDTLIEPVGEYAQSALGRERMFEYGSRRHGTPCVLLRLNYATELRYGVLVDIARKVWERRPVDVHMGMANVIWQGDANSWCLQSFAHCQSPPLVLNITGPEILSVRWVAKEFGTRFSIEPIIEGEEAPSALLNNAARAMQLFGYPTVTPVQMIDWIAEWIQSGGSSLGKPTHFETRDGRF
jgi:nucleoside-diphosphate-sugar epimerase